MSRTTRQHLQERLDILKTLMNRQDLAIKTWSPGDGWTRYQIVSSGNNGETIPAFGGRTYRISEIFDCINFAIYAIDAQDKELSCDSKQTEKLAPCC